MSVERPPELSKDAAGVLFTELDADRDTYITAEDIIAFIRRHAMSLPLSLAPKMIEEGKGAYTPEGKMTLQDMKQASGFRKQRTIKSDAPDALHGTTHHAEYEYKLRPYREQWLSLATAAVPDGRIFTPPTTVTVESRKQRVSSSPSRSRQARNMSPTRTLTVDPSLYIQRSMMIHGVRGDGDERLQHAAQAHANEHELESPSIVGVYRRPMVEQTLNRAATHHLRPIDRTGPSSDSTLQSNDGGDGLTSLLIIEEDGGGDESMPTRPEATPVITPLNPATDGLEATEHMIPITPIAQVYDFDTKAAYEDVNKLLRVDSLVDEIRVMTTKDSKTRQRSGITLHDTWKDNKSFASTQLTQRQLIAASASEGSFDTRSQKTRVPVTRTSELSKRPLQRTVDGTALHGLEEYDDDGDVVGDGVGIEGGSQVGLGTGSLGGGSTFGRGMTASSLASRSFASGGSGGIGLANGGLGLMLSRANSSRSTSRGVWSTDDGSQLQAQSPNARSPDVFSPTSLSSPTQFGMGFATDADAQSLARSKQLSRGGGGQQSLSQLLPRTSGSMLSNTGSSALLLRPSTQSTASLMLGASQQLARTDSSGKSTRRKQELLERQLTRISVLSGRPVTATGVPTLALKVRGEVHVDTSPQVRAFGYNKPQESREVLLQSAMERREMHGEWKPPQTPEFRPKVTPADGKDRDNAFAYTNRVITSSERAKTSHTLRLQKITALSDSGPLQDGSDPFEPSVTTKSALGSTNGSQFRASARSLLS